MRAKLKRMTWLQAYDTVTNLSTQGSYVLHQFVFQIYSKLDTRESMCILHLMIFWH